MAASSILVLTELENIIPNIRVRVQIKYVYRFIFMGVERWYSLVITDWLISAFLFNNQLFKKLEFVETNCENHPSSKIIVKKSLANKP